MTTYTSIPNSDVDAESPITQSLMERLRDNPLAIREGDASAPKIQVNVSPGATALESDGTDGYVLTVQADTTVRPESPASIVGKGSGSASVGSANNYTITSLPDYCHVLLHVYWTVGATPNRLYDTWLCVDNFAGSLSPGNERRLKTVVSPASTTYTIQTPAIDASDAARYTDPDGSWISFKMLNANDLYILITSPLSSPDYIVTVEWKQLNLE